MNHQLVMWVVFNLVVAAMLYIDLAVAQKKSHAVGMKEAALWSLVWVGVSLLFSVGIHFYLSPEKALQFLTGYVIEKSLSVDNMFVFIMIFSFFAVEPAQQPRVLKWGILGALGMRFVLIFVGAALVERFHWVLYLFGAILLWSAYKMAFGVEKQFNPDENPLFRRLKSILPMTGVHGDRFFVRIGGRLHTTPLFLALVVVEFSDLVFALDSIPAIFSITTDTFLVYTSNVFAILGLRALYFLVNGLVQIFAYLKYGVAVILGFVGIKMLVNEWFHISTAASMGVVLGVLVLSVLLSVLRRPRPPEKLEGGA
ncbi:MAG: TerC family protein [Elusimicrobia bacterium]|nr:TerC family protein [Elusimicrobiota bacterium]